MTSHFAYDLVPNTRIQNEQRHVGSVAWLKAVNNRGNNYTQQKHKARIKRIETIRRYMEELNRTDRQSNLTTGSHAKHIKDKIAAFKHQAEESNA